MLLTNTAILPYQPEGLLGHQETGGHKRPCDNVVQSLMSGDSTRNFIADESMRAAGFDLSATAVRVWHKQHCSPVVDSPRNGRTRHRDGDSMN